MEKSKLEIKNKQQNKQTSEKQHVYSKLLQQVNTAPHQKRLELPCL